ncbi:hypothetical protein Cpa01nite_32190 [Cellulomonas pakistanensis]|uniref:Uncharacterized protein n=1 Tax=Cellulomonas pakistanensis TaxID=992287 RepID=A0A919U405_9CELL|nr:hypothetical protein Cpa01nite_32190 [Cellulomonas pakistanensis]
MPLRSVKMKRFILGFQRRVWCPKWTPLSSSWRMVTTAMVVLPRARVGGAHSDREPASADPLVRLSTPPERASSLAPRPRRHRVEDPDRCRRRPSARTSPAGAVGV